MRKSFRVTSLSVLLLIVMAITGGLFNHSVERLSAQTQPGSVDLSFVLPVYQPSDVIVKHKYYVLSYEEKCEQAKWVAYRLTANMVTGNAVRHNNFKADPAVPTGSAQPEDYTGSGYDKGHLMPADDCSFSQQAMDDTFCMSNMSPQLHSLNAGIWKSLETKEREWAQSKDSKLYNVDSL